MSGPSPSRITGVRPLWAVEGGRLSIAGSGFTVEPLPEVRIGGIAARLACVSSRSLTAIVPSGLDGGRTPVRIDSAPGETAYVQVGAPLATGLHQVDNPAFDAEGNLYVTFSGSRGQQTPVAIFLVRPDGTRQPYASGIPNPTSLAFDAEGTLHVSSRFDGTVSRIERDGSVRVVASELGVACGIAFDREGTLFVGDRSGSILRVVDGRATTFASLPTSVAAFHLTFGPDGALFVTAPTLSTRDAIYRISPSGDVEVFHEGFGRPQGLTFNELGQLYVVDALAGRGGLYRIDMHTRNSEQLIAAGGLVGVAFGPGGVAAVTSGDTAFVFSGLG